MFSTGASKQENMHLNLLSPTNRLTDQQTDIVLYRAAIAAKNKTTSIDTSKQSDSAPS